MCSVAFQPSPVLPFPLFGEPKTPCVGDPTPGRPCGTHFLNAAPWLLLKIALALSAALAAIGCLVKTLISQLPIFPWISHSFDLLQDSLLSQLADFALLLLECSLARFHLHWNLDDSPLDSHAKNCSAVEEENVDCPVTKPVTCFAYRNPDADYLGL